MKRVAVLAIIFAAACASAPDGPVTVKILQAGVIMPGNTPRRPENVRGAGPMYSTRMEPTVSTITDTIPAQIGTGLGIRFIAERQGGGFIDLRVRYTHPRFTNPDTGKPEEVTEQSGRVLSGRAEVVGYYFDVPEELQPGDWTIDVLDGDHVLASHTFQVIHPSLLH